MTLTSIASFLGYDNESEKIKKIAEITSFQSLRNNEKLDMTSPAFDPTEERFLRKGQIGDWKNYFSSEQLHQFDEKFVKFQQETGLQFRYE